MKSNERIRMAVKAAVFVMLLPGISTADLLTPTDMETACAGVPARNCSASGSVPWRLPRILDSVSETTGDWQWTVHEGNLDGDDRNRMNDIQVIAGRHPQVHSPEGIGRLLSVNFFNIDFAPQGSKPDVEQHVGGGHSDSLVAAIVEDGTRGMLVTIELRHPSAVVVPEPSIPMLLIVGATGLIGWRRWQFRPNA